MTEEELQRQEDYTQYYEARMKKYEDNSNYANSYQTEKALYELMRDAKSKEEYQEKFFGEKLNIKNAIALVKDQETMRLKHFHDIKEDIRARGPKSVLAEVDSFEDEAALTTRVPELLQKNSVEISVDGFADYFYSDFLVLEHLEVARRAEVPSKWKGEQEDYIKKYIEEGREDWQSQTIPNAQKWDPSWQFDYNLIQEERHRRLIPVPDSVVKRRIDEHKEYRGLK